MLSYREGNSDRPRGHALLVFRDADDPSVVWATYLVVAPIVMDLGKYIPAAFAPNLGAQLAAEGPTAYPLPPIPEKIAGGYAVIEQWARIRSDDVLDGGALRVSEPFAAMHPVAEVAREYAAAYQRFLESGRAPLPVAELEPATSSESNADVDNLLLQVMPDAEKVSRIARLTGTLRYAVEGGDQAAVAETTAEMERVGRHLGEKYRVPDLIASARASTASAGELARLYVERCYRMAEEDYAALAALESQIERLRADS